MEEKLLLEKRYQVLSESEDLIAILTPDRVRKHVNKAYCDFFGRSEAELIGKSIFEEFDAAKLNFYNEFIGAMSCDNPSIKTVNKSGMPGSQKWIYWIGNGIYDERGNLMEVLSIGKDIDEHVKTDRKNDEINNLLIAYRDAINSNVICSITDRDGIITYVNKCFCDISKYSATEMIGKSHNIINSGFHSSDFFKNMWSTISAGAMWHGEIKNKAKDGSYYWVKTVIIPVKDSEQKVSSFLSLRVLINDRKQIEEERARHTKALEDMMFMVSHELRRPITNFMGILDILQTAIAEDDEHRKLINYLIQSMEQLDFYSRKMNDYLQEHKTITGPFLS